MNPSTVLSQDEKTLPALKHGWHTDLIGFVQHGLPKIVGALVIAILLQWIVAFFVRRMRRQADKLKTSPQRAAQMRTLAGIIRATAYSLLALYVFLQVLGALGAPLGSFIGAAGVVGLGISFGAQSIFKDMLNGLFILMEDQYNVGDVVKIAGLQGTVEDLTLRTTKLRDGDGTLYIVPNSQIATVSNLSRDFSVATLNVSVDAQIDPDRVIALLKQLSSELRNDADFKSIFLANPEVLGVDKISGNEVVYPVNLRVLANQRDGVLRELRRRILLTFNKENIPFGTATTALIMQKSDPTAPAAQPS